MDNSNWVIESYITWLRGRLKATQTEDYIEITTPFLDDNNDHIQIYVTKQNGDFKVSDDGDTIRELRANGLELKGPIREKILWNTLLGLGVQLDGDELIAKASARNLPQKVHDVIQASISLGEMRHLARRMVANLFKEDVSNFLKENNVRSVRSIKITGKSGIDQYFDFVIPESSLKPERVVQAISNPTVQSAKIFIMAWFDTYGQSRPMSIAFAFLNDQENEVKGEVKNALEQYKIKPVLWSSREEILQELTS
ncbi:MAG: DUF1829 domain-containing protein [Thermoplasmatales archaeon]|nr:DUF1829 domain-containing protein [Thermoplasmatales archaeon]